MSEISKFGYYYRVRYKFTNLSCKSHSVVQGLGTGFE